MLCTFLGTMRIVILHNSDHEHLTGDPGKVARADVLDVARAVGDALRRGAHEVDFQPVVHALDGLEAALAENPPDVVVNLCESLGGDSRGEMAVPEMLDRLGLPYTGSCPMALGRALHKGDAKANLRIRGIPTPDFWLVETVEELAFLKLHYPLIVKPSREDASVGIDFDSVVHDYPTLSRAVGQVLQTFQQPALIEQYIEGREIYVPLLGNTPRRALPLSEICFGKAFENRPHIVSYKAKWEPQSPEFVDSRPIRCELDPLLEKHLVEVAVGSFEAIGGRDYGRVDLRLTENGKAHVIDVNPNCDLHPEAGFAKAAALAGLGYDDLILQLLQLALERHHAHSALDPSGQRSFGFVTPANRNLLARRGGVRS